MSIVFPLIVAVLGQSSVVDQLPKELRARVTNRDYKTSQIDWSLSWFGGDDDGLVEKYITRRAGDDLWQSNLGDENGFHRTTYEGGWASDDLSWQLKWTPRPPERTAGTQNALTHAGRLWYVPRAEHSRSGLVKDPSTAVSHLPFDFSAAGIAPRFKGLSNSNALGINERALNGLGSANVYESYAGGYRTITAEYGMSRLVWYMDAQQGNRPVRAEFYANDELAYSSQTEYQRVGDRWIVESMKFYKGYENSPYQIVDVQKASFDEPWHMQSITPSDIGALFGFEFSDAGRFYFWGGNELLTSDEYDELIYIDGLRPDPELIRRNAKSVGMSVERYLEGFDITAKWMRKKYFNEHGKQPWLADGVVLKPGEKDEWDVYVEKFIAEHKLTGEVVKRAKDILKRSKKLRDVRRRKNSPKILQAKRDGDAKKLAHYEGITKRIFEEVLVRALNRLLPKSAQDSKTPKVAGKD